MGVLFSCPVEEEEDMPAGAALPAPGCGGGGNAGVEPTALKPSLAGSGKLRFERSLGSLIRREQQSPSARLQVDATKIPATSPRATVAPVQPVMPRELARTRVADAAAAVTVQKVYKSFRTRRRLADCAVVVEQSWWELLDFALLRRSSVSFFDIEGQESAVSKWARARTRAAKVGKGLSKDEKAQKLALQHWLEAIDPRHRYGHNLHYYYDCWLRCESKEPFFYWLDVGEGKEINLERCPRLKLLSQCIKYLGPKEREEYEVVIEDGKFMFKKSRQILDTSGGPRDAKWIFVLSTSKNLYVGQKKKGTFQHSSFLAGGATSAAGRLVVEDGILKAIWPHSGHYRPTEENFQEFQSFLKDNSVDLTDVKMSPDEDDEEFWSRLRSIPSDCCAAADKPEQDQQAAAQETNPCQAPQEATESTTPDEVSQQEETSKSLSPTATVTRQDSTEDAETSTSDHRALSEDSQEENNAAAADDDNTAVPREKILQRISSKKETKSYQLGKQVSFKWTTGAGARIVCVRDYPSELQLRALEQVHLSGGREFVEVKEFGVPDILKSMAWCGDNICLGIRREYMIINSMTGALTEVFSSGRIAPPLVVPLPTGELILGKDNIGVFVDQNGKLIQDGRIIWSDTPASVVIHRPYAVARLPRHVEIRSLRAPNALVQTVVLRDVQKLVQTDNCILAALSNSVHGLLPVPIGAQIVQLTASGEFDEALALCKLLPPEDSNLRAAKESSIHIRYGHFLFDSGSYEEAMEQFSDSHVDITYVLSLYPSIVLPQTNIIGEHDKLLDMPELARESSDVTDEMESYSLQLHESDDKSPLEVKKMSHNALAALVKYLQKKRSGIIERATAEVTEEVVSGAVHHSLKLSEPYKPKKLSKKRAQTHTSSIAREMATVLDTSLLQALILTGQSSGAIELLKGLNYCDLKICEEFLKERSEYMVLLELYKSNEMHREALRLLNQLVEESKSEMENTDFNKKFNPQMILEYLRPLCRSDPMLVLESSLYVLERNPSETIQLFLSENVPADLVNSYLKQHAPNLQSTYLELMLSMNDTGINPNLQNELVQLYLSEVLDWYKILKEEGNWTERTYSPTRKKLISTLESNSGYNTDLLLKRLPQDTLFEERAILYGKINQHLRALSLYVHKLQMPERAVAYCDRVYEEREEQPSKSNIYFNLLQIYLNPRKAEKEFEQKIIPVASQYSGIQKATATKLKGGRIGKKVVEIEGADDIRFSPSGTDSGRSDGDGDDVNDGGPIMLNEALELLSQRWDRINGAQALRLLPRDTKLQDLVSFLEPLLRNSSEHRRNYLVIKNLIFRANLQVKEDLYKRCQAVVKIDGDSTCSLCHKRVANSAFAIYPNGQTLVHFVCFKESQQIKAVRGANSVKRR